jgi:hypothetical protein
MSREGSSQISKGPPLPPERRAFLHSFKFEFGLSLVYFVQFRQEFRVFRDALVVFFRETDDTLLVDDEHSALGKALRSQAVIETADTAVGIKIGQHGEIDAAHLLRKGFVRKR